MTPRVPRRRLSDAVALDLGYADHTRFGAMISGRVDREIARSGAAALAALERLRGEEGGRALRPSHAELRRLLHESAYFAELFSSPSTLREEWLYPDPAASYPETLFVHDERANELGVTAIPLPRALVPDLARWLGDFQRGALAPRSPAARELFFALASAGALDPCGTGDSEPPSAERLGAEPCPAQLIGHASVAIASKRTRVLVDPFFLPPGPSARGGEGLAYRPLSLREVPADAVLITHGHPDHFHLGTLLRLGAATPLFVPEIARESVLSLDLASRLRELGFVNVRTLRWGESAIVGDTRVAALPFHGEQPTSGDVLHPEVRNEGNLYVIEAEGRRYGFTADAGRDISGDCRWVAAAARQRLGSVDVLFGGYRRSALFPLQLVATSLARYLPFVPPSEWSVRQTLMNGPEELLDTAESWGAQVVVPYADGGAPWYWRRGLGPALDDVRGGDRHAALRPESVSAHGLQRSSWEEGAPPLASPVEVRVLRPGESLRWDEPEPRERGEAREGGLAPRAPVTVRHEGHRWPYAAAEGIQEKAPVGAAMAPSAPVAPAPSSEADLLVIAPN